MRAIVVNELGGPEVLRLGEAPRPEPGPGQVLIRVHRAGVNFSDTERRRGVYRRPDLPWIPGTEGAGIVVETGERVAFWAMPPAVSGSYAEYAVAPTESLFRLGSVSFEEGAALPQQGLTAYGVVHLGAKIEAGQTVLIHAAGGGVGLLAVQMAKRAGARVLGTVSNEAKAEAVRAVGGEPLEYGEDLARRVLDATDGRGVDVVLDSVGRATQDVSLEVLARFGLLLFYGDASGPPLPIDPDRLYERSLKIGSYTLDVNYRPEIWRAARQELLRWVEEGSLRLTISAVLPLEDATEAHRRLESRQSFGKIVLDVLAIPGEVR
ncbi:MAG: NADPH:quinone reductase [Acidobacteriota bacterium]|jgi:NADPH2:quinone reductase|nr:NADPH:quinone reductase [Acidobacteriota bacterium]